MNRTIWIVFGIVVFVGVVGSVWYFWNMTTQPLYQPGSLQNGKYLSGSLEPPEQLATENFWQVEPDIQLHHFSEGRGRNVLIVHGGPGQPYVEPWEGLDDLTSSYRFHYYDQRGAGHSTRPINTFDSRNFYANAQKLEETLGLSAQLADIERIRRILGEEKLILIGHSFGAFQAALYAAEFPENVEALVLVTPAPMLVMPMEVPGLFDSIENLLPPEMLPDYQSWQEAYFDFGNLFERSEDDLVAMNEEIGHYFTAAIGAEPEELPEDYRPGGWMVHAMYLSMGQRHDYRPAMADVQVPVLVIHAADDFQSEAASRTYLEVFPKAQFEIIEGAGHMVFDDQPAAFGQITGKFLQRY